MVRTSETIFLSYGVTRPQSIFLDSLKDLNKLALNLEEAID